MTALKVSAITSNDDLGLFSIDASGSTLLIGEWACHWFDSINTLNATQAAPFVPIR